ncbi:multiple epidermal growth factor-like domains protein 10 [Cylas formicarius]|uniref:multiple epidermal growth factor-like domains protein 10 n=1 Tax=Cylas formicarius TaxID=197179 RepID=UPI002958ACB1|nr:multiple epidermal growth factor-like domains protein 10 [Cylas formicarius]
MYKLVLSAFCILIHSNEIHSQDLRAVRQRLVSYQRCLLDSDCRENSFCFDNDQHRIGICKCTDGYELLYRNRTYYACLKFAGYDQECVQDTQCIESLGALSTCDGFCKCVDGAHRYTDGRCYKSILLDDFCQTDANCILGDGTFAFCADGQCSCNLKQQPSADKLSCIETRNLGESCSDNNQCSLTENAICREVCRCAAGYVLSRNRTACLKAATYFLEPCEENPQCSEFLRGAACVAGNCSCMDGFHGFENTCARSAGLGEACAALEECVTERQFGNIVNCTEGICQCQRGVVDERHGCSRSDDVPVNDSLIVFFTVIYLIKAALDW